MATISFGGLGNGVDFGQVVSQLVKVQQLPIDQLNQKKKDLQTKLSDYDALGAKLLALQGAADKLRLSQRFDQNSSTVSDETVLTATASTTAGAGSYTIQVTQLAKAHQVTNKAAKAVASTATDIVSGGSATFTFRVGNGTDHTVTLGDSATLEDLRTAINDLGAGVTASVINTGTEAVPTYRLTLTATNSGASNTITVVADGTTLDFVNGSGSGGADTLQAAQNAILVIGDPDQTTLTIQRESNVVSDAIPDVTLTLKAKTAEDEPVTVNVSRDTGAIKKNVEGLVTAYNDIVKFINERSTYDITTKTGGDFFNEATTKTILSRLRTALSNGVEGLATYTSVGQIGFKTERDGTITLDAAKLDAALSTNYSAVKSLFINQTTVSGVAQRINEAVDVLDDVESGSFSIRKAALSDRIADLSDEIARKEDLLSKYEERLRAQYAALDGLLRRLQGQTSFLQSGLTSSQ
ncbi:MAG TPA: flagellar filament capping protein FliD [Nitrospiraceae bacterium]|nr:flagellar filament capping protein FliD [Nitrospiraceae bacterium]